MTVSKAMNLLPISSACLLSGIISLYYNGIYFSDACVFVLFGRNGVYQAERGCLHFKTRLSVVMKTVMQVGVMKQRRKQLCPRPRLEMFICIVLRHYCTSGEKSSFPNGKPNTILSYNSDMNTLILSNCNSHG